MFPTSAFLSLCLPISMLPCKWGSTVVGGDDDDDGGDYDEDTCTAVILQIQ